MLTKRTSFFLILTIIGLSFLIYSLLPYFLEIEHHTKNMSLAGGTTDALTFSFLCDYRYLVEHYSLPDGQEGISAPTIHIKFNQTVLMRTITFLGTKEYPSEWHRTKNLWVMADDVIRVEVKNENRDIISYNVCQVESWETRGNIELIPFALGFGLFVLGAFAFVKSSENNVN